MTAAENEIDSRFTFAQHLLFLQVKTENFGIYRFVRALEQDKFIEDFNVITDWLKEHRGVWGKFFLKESYNRKTLKHLKCKHFRRSHSGFIAFRIFSSISTLFSSIFIQATCELMESCLKKIGKQTEKKQKKS
jgi:hypothetical protein